MGEPANYAEKVYAGVLGKVIGVYLGKPFEGWLNADIETRLGEIWYYVHDRLNYPLVCADDDISGTFTFLRALEDHPAGAAPGGRPGLGLTSEQIGKTWLNYLIEYQTVLWWGGMGVSSEHTAWLRLAGGVLAPESGSIGMNGLTVAEQIGAQIFIDGWGMVAPGDPELAARLAGQAARVSHDGEAVYAAQAVAAMESAAFDESNMDKLLDVGLAGVPADCLIARIHRDVRGWAAKFGDDWRATFRKIQAKYGYDKYGGGCHVVPNHAVMVMAWAHAQGSVVGGKDDFQKSLMIANTAGWDTDCNSGNVGCLMGIKDGLAGINAGPHWQRPFADRMIIPTAEGTHGITDALLQADLVARLGRRVMGWAGAEEKDAGTPRRRDAEKTSVSFVPVSRRPGVPASLPSGPRFHFSLPGSQHGFLPERAVATDDDTYVINTAGKLHIEFRGIAPGKPARVVTPTYLTPDQLARAARAKGGYALAVAPTLYSGQTVTASLAATHGQKLTARLFIRHYVRGAGAANVGGDLAGLAFSKPVKLSAGATAKTARIKWVLPDTKGWPIAQLGLQIDGAAGSAGMVDLDWLTWGGTPTINFTDVLTPQRGQGAFLGWISNCETAYRDAWGPIATLVSNRGVGLVHTGTADWGDYAVSGRMAVRLADRGGLVARYGGLYRYIALVYNRVAGELQLVRQHDDRSQLLAKTPCEWQLNEEHSLRLEVKGNTAAGYVDGQARAARAAQVARAAPVLEARFEGLARSAGGGGIACLTDNGTTSFAGIGVEAV